MNTQARQQALDEIRGYIDFEITSGFSVAGFDHIIDMALAAASDGDDVEPLRPWAEQLLREAIASKQAEEKRWPAVTDCDRLDLAFAALENVGIICRQHFCCCGMCGVAEMPAQIEQERRAGREFRGYTFYHVQETQLAILYGSLSLNYGPTLGGEKECVDIGREIVSTLRAHGLQVEWDETMQKRIGIKLDWKRRRLQSGR